MSAPALAPTVARARPGIAPFPARLAWNFAAEAAARGASVVLALACARAMSVEDHGRFALALATAQFSWLAAEVVVNGGFSTRELVRERSRADGDPARLAGAFAAGRLACGVATGLLVAASVSAWPMQPETRHALQVAAIGPLALAAFPDWALRGWERFHALALANAAAALVALGAAWFVVPRLPRPEVGIAAWLGSLVVGALVAWPLLAAGRGVARPRTAALLPRLERSFVYAIGAVLAIACVQAPLLLAAMLSDATETGRFGAVARLVSAWLGVVAVLWWPLSPEIARLPAGSLAHRRLVGRAACAVLALAVPPALTCALWPATVLTTLFGERYAAAAPALAIAAWVAPLHALTGLLEQAALAHGGERTRVRVHGSALLVLLAVGGLAVMRAGGTGAAAALVAGFATATAGYLLALRDTLPTAELAKACTPAILAGVALAAFALAARAAGVPAPVAIASVLGAGASVAALCARAARGRFA